MSPPRVKRSPLSAWNSKRTSRRVELFVDRLGLDIQPLEHSRNDASLRHPTDAENGDDEVPVEAPNRTTRSSRHGKFGVTVQSVRVLLGFEMQGAQGCGRVDLNLLDPSQAVRAEEAPRDGVQGTLVLIPEPE